MDQPAEPAYLTLDHVPSLPSGFLAPARRVKHSYGVADNVERVAQLVAQHGEELVLRPIDRLHVGPSTLLELKLFQAGDVLKGLIAPTM